MPLASFHYVFESHQALLAEVLRELTEGELQRNANFRLWGDDEHDMLVNGLYALLEDVAARADHLRALNELLQYAGRTTGLEDLPVDFAGDLRRGLEGRIEEWARATGIALSRPSSELADAWFVAAGGVCTSYLVTHDLDGIHAIVPLLLAAPARQAACC